MYIPEYFKESDPDRLLSIMQQHSFALLISQEDGAPVATHLPLLAERREDGTFVLSGHVAQANQQWRSAEGQRVLSVFSGPHAYISPSWYESPRTVPTWNYVAVHTYGILRAVTDAAETMALLERTVAAYESPDSSWKFDVGEDYFKHLANSVVAFRIEVDRIEGKLKLSQNQPVERQENVMRALEQRGAPDDWAIAEWMRKTLTK